MSTTLILAIVTITLALVFYTIGVFSERKARTLRTWHVVTFWIGFLFDSIGTSLMSRMAGGFTINLHGITGMIAIVLMAIHAIWATVTLIKGDVTAKARFHKFSIFVWLIWLIPYVLGMILGLQG